MVLQSYLSALILKYAKLYIKNIEANLRLTLWGGDVVLNNVELRLDVIKDLISLPQELDFTKGFVKELRIHVPWSSLTSSPVEVTLCGVQCIIANRKSDRGYMTKGRIHFTESSTAIIPTAEEIQAAEAEARRQGQGPGTDDAEGWIQGLITRIASNVSVSLLDLSITFSEDNVIASLNLDSIKVFSTSKDWTPQFCRLVGPWKLVNKMIELRGISLCMQEIIAPAQSTRHLPSLPPQKQPAEAAVNSYGLYNPVNISTITSTPQRQHLTHPYSQSQTNPYQQTMTVQQQVPQAQYRSYPVGGGAIGIDFGAAEQSNRFNIPRNEDTVIISAPSIDLRLCAHLQPLLSNRRPLPQSVLLAASAEILATSSTVSGRPELSLDIAIEAPVMLVVQPKQIPLLMKLLSSFGTLGTSPVSTDPIPFQVGQYLATSSIAVPVVAQQTTTSLSSSQFDLDFGGVNDNVRSDTSAVGGAGMISWLWKSNTANDLDSAPSLSLQQWTLLSQLQQFVPRPEFALCLHLPVLQVILKTDEPGGSSVFCRLELCDTRVQAIVAQPISSNPTEAPSITAQTARTLQITAMLQLGALALLDISGTTAASSVPNPLRSNYGRGPQPSVSVPHSIAVVQPVLLAGDTRLISAVYQFLPDCGAACEQDVPKVFFPASHCLHPVCRGLQNDRPIPAPDANLCSDIRLVSIAPFMHISVCFNSADHTSVMDVPAASTDIAVTINTVAVLTDFLSVRNTRLFHYLSVLIAPLLVEQTPKSLVNTLPITMLTETTTPSLFTSMPVAVVNLRLKLRQLVLCSRLLDYLSCAEWNTDAAFMSTANALCVRIADVDIALGFDGRRTAMKYDVSPPGVLPGFAPVGNSSNGSTRHQSMVGKAWSMLRPSAGMFGFNRQTKQPVASPTQAHLMQNVTLVSEFVRSWLAIPSHSLSIATLSLHCGVVSVFTKLIRTTPLPELRVSAPLVTLSMPYYQASIPASSSELYDVEKIIQKWQITLMTISVPFVTNTLSATPQLLPAIVSVIGVSVDVRFVSPNITSEISPLSKTENLANVLRAFLLCNIGSDSFETQMNVSRVEVALSPRHFHFLHLLLGAMQLTLATSFVAEPTDMTSCTAAPTLNIGCAVEIRNEWRYRLLQRRPSLYIHQLASHITPLWPKFCLSKVFVGNILSVAINSVHFSMRGLSSIHIPNILDNHDLRTVCGLSVADIQCGISSSDSVAFVPVISLPEVLLTSPTESNCEKPEPALLLNLEISNTFWSCLLNTESDKQDVGATNSITFDDMLVSALAENGRDTAHKQLVSFSLFLAPGSVFYDVKLLQWFSFMPVCLDILSDSTGIVNLQESYIPTCVARGDPAHPSNAALNVIIFRPVLNPQNALMSSIFQCISIDIRVSSFSILFEFTKNNAVTTTAPLHYPARDTHRLQSFKLFLPLIQIQAIDTDHITLAISNLGLRLICTSQEYFTAMPDWSIDVSCRYSHIPNISLDISIATKPLQIIITSLLLTSMGVILDEISSCFSGMPVEAVSLSSGNCDENSLVPAVRLQMHLSGVCLDFYPDYREVVAMSDIPHSNRIGFIMSSLMIHVQSDEHAMPLRLFVLLGSISVLQQDIHVSAGTVTHPIRQFISFGSSSLAIEIVPPMSHQNNNFAVSFRHLIVAGIIGSLTVTASPFLFNIMSKLLAAYSTELGDPNLPTENIFPNTIDDLSSNSFPPIIVTQTSPTNAASPYQTRLMALISPTDSVILCCVRVRPINMSFFPSASVTNLPMDAVVFTIDAITIHSSPPSNAAEVFDAICSLQPRFLELRQRCYDTCLPTDHIAINTRDDCELCHMLFTPVQIDESHLVEMSVFSILLRLAVKNISLGNAQCCRDPVSDAFKFVTRMTLLPLSLTVNLSLLADYCDDVEDVAQDTLPKLRWSEFQCECEMQRLRIEIEPACLALFLVIGNAVIKDPLFALHVKDSNSSIQRHSEIHVSSNFPDVRVRFVLQELSVVLRGAEDRYDSLELDARQWSFSFHMSQSTWQANVVLTSITPIYNQTGGTFVMLTMLPQTDISSSHDSLDTRTQPALLSINVSSNLIQQSHASSLVVVSKSSLEFGGRSENSTTCQQVVVEMESFELWFALDILPLCFSMASAVHSLAQNTSALANVTIDTQPKTYSCDVFVPFAPIAFDGSTASLGSALTVKVIMRGSSVSLFHSCLDATRSNSYPVSGAGTQLAVDAVRFNWSQIFLMMSPPVLQRMACSSLNPASVGSPQIFGNQIGVRGLPLFQSRTRIELSVFGLDIRLFDQQMAMRGCSSWSLAKTQSIRIVLEQELRSELGARFSFYGANSVDLSIENTINCRVFPSLITWIDRLMKSVFSYLPTSVVSLSANYSDRVVTADVIDSIDRRQFFIDDLRTMSIEKYSCARPQAGFLSFSQIIHWDSLPSLTDSSLDESRWISWRYLSPRAVTHVAIGSLELSMLASRASHNSASPPAGTIVLRLLAYDSCRQKFQLVYEVRFSPNVASLITILESDRVSADEWKVEWTGFAATSENHGGAPSVQELGQLLRIDSVLHHTFVPTVQLTLQLQQGLSMSISDLGPTSVCVKTLPRSPSREYSNQTELLSLAVSSISGNVVLWSTVTMSSSVVQVSANFNIDGVSIAYMKHAEGVYRTLVHPFGLNIGLSLGQFQNALLSYQPSEPAIVIPPPVSCRAIGTTTKAQSQSLVQLETIVGAMKVVLDCQFSEMMRVDISLSALVVLLATATEFTEAGSHNVSSEDFRNNPVMLESGTILDKVNASIPMPPGHVLSRYLLMNKTGFDLDLEQVGSNIYRRLPSCTRDFIESSWKSFEWLDIQSELADSYSMLPDNMYTNSLRHRVRVRGCGALLWSEEFDFDTVLTPFMVKLFLENSEMPSCYSKLAAHVQSPILSTCVWINLKSVGGSTYITMLPSHTMLNRYLVPLNVGLSITDVSCDVSAGTVVFLGTLPSETALSIPILFPEELPTHSLDPLAATVSRISISAVKRPVYQSNIFIQSCVVSDQLPTDQQWTLACSIPMNSKSLLAGVDESWLVSLTRTNIHDECLSCVTKHEPTHNVICLHKSSPAVSVDIPVKNSPIILSILPLLLFRNESSVVVRVAVVHSRMMQSEVKCDTAVRNTVDPPSAGVIQQALLSDGYTVGPNDITSILDFDPSTGDNWFAVLPEFRAGEPASSPFMLSLLNLETLELPQYIACHSVSDHPQSAYFSVTNCSYADHPIDLTSLDTPLDSKRSSLLHCSNEPYVLGTAGVASKKSVLPTIVIALHPPVSVRSFSDVDLKIDIGTVASRSSPSERVLITVPPTTDGPQTMSVFKSLDLQKNLDIRFANMSTESGFCEIIHFSLGSDLPSVFEVNIFSTGLCQLIVSVERINNFGIHANRPIRIEIKPRYVIHNHTSRNVDLLRLSGPFGSDRVDKNGLSVLISGAFIGASQWHSESLADSPNSKHGVLTAESVSAKPASVLQSGSAASRVTVAVGDGTQDTTGQINASMQPYLAVRLASADSMQVSNWSDTFAVPDEAARHHLIVQHSGYEELVSFVVLRHLNVSHLVLFLDSQPPQVLVNSTPFLLQFRHANARSDMFHDILSGCISEILPIDADFQGDEALSGSYPGWEKEEHIFDNGSDIAITDSLLPSSSASMQHFQRSLVMRLCCATSLATSARASTTLTSDSQVILQTGLDHVGRRTVTLSDGQQLVVEQVTRRGTTVITVSLPEILSVGRSITVSSICADVALAGISVVMLHELESCGRRVQQNALTLLEIDPDVVPIAILSLHQLKISLTADSARLEDENLPNAFLMADAIRLAARIRTTVAVSIHSISIRNVASDAEHITVCSLVGAVGDATSPALALRMVLATPTELPLLHASSDIVKTIFSDIDIISMSVCLQRIYTAIELPFVTALTEFAMPLAALGQCTSAKYRHVHVRPDAVQLLLMAPPMDLIRMLSLANDGTNSKPMDALPANFLSSQGNFHSAVDPNFVLLVDSITLPRLFVHRVEISAVNIRVRVSAALGPAFFGIQNMPIRFNAVQLAHVLCTPDRLVKELMASYLADAIVRTPMLIGSLDLLGSPTLLFERINTGVTDLIQMPSKAYSSGAGVQGITAAGLRGVTSLLANISAGTLDSVAGFSSSISRNLHSMSAIEGEELQISLQRFASQSKSLTSGFRSGALSFSASLLSAATGLIVAPIAALRKNSSTLGFFKGVGQGLFGAFAKPIGGVLSLISNTSKGFSQSVWAPDEYSVSSVASESALDCSMDLLQSLPKQNTGNFANLHRLIAYQFGGILVATGRCLRWTNDRGSYDLVGTALLTTTDLLLMLPPRPHTLDMKMEFQQRDRVVLRFILSNWTVRRQNSEIRLILKKKSNNGSSQSHWFDILFESEDEQAVIALMP